MDNFVRYVTKNIFNSCGQLLLVKGSKLILNERNRKRLEAIGVYEDVLANTSTSYVPPETLQSEANNSEPIRNVNTFTLPGDISQDSMTVSPLIPNITSKAVLVAEPNTMTIITPNKSNDSGMDQDEYVRQLTNLFTVKNYINDDRLYFKATELVEGILYNSKDKPWYYHISGLVNYVDWIYSHSINTAIISGIIGASMRYSDDALHELVLGAILHDIGMILVPRTILCKASKLLPEEMAIVRNHSELGCAMVAHTDIPELSRKIIAQHHERMDGSGYPNGLAGSKIDRFAQIVMIADSFDTATSSRPYKAMKPTGVVIEEMRNLKSSYNQEILEEFASFLVFTE